MKGWVGHVGWPTGQTQDSKSLPVKDQHSTTVPCITLCCITLKNATTYTFSQKLLNKSAVLVVISLSLQSNCERLLKSDSICLKNKGPVFFGSQSVYVLHSFIWSTFLYFPVSLLFFFSAFLCLCVCFYVFLHESTCTWRVFKWHCWR